MKLIYIAGPYRPYTCADGTWVGTPMNIRNAEVTAVNLVDTLGHLGLFPVVPHLNTRDFENQVKKNDDQYFLDGTMAMLERCDAVLLTMPNADVVSTGTKAEVHRAHQLGIQVYRSFDALRRAAQENQIVRLPTPAAFYANAGFYRPGRLQQSPYDTAMDIEKAKRIREEFMQLHPEVRKVWDDHGPLTTKDFPKLIETKGFPGVRSYGQSISILMTEPPFTDTQDKDEIEFELLDERGERQRIIARRGSDRRTWTAKCGALNYTWIMDGETDPSKDSKESYKSKLEHLKNDISRVVEPSPSLSVKAIDLRPGDTLISGDVVNSTEQLEGEIVKVKWNDGSAESYHYTEIFKVVMRHKENDDAE